MQKSQLLTNKYPFAKPTYRSACAAGQRMPPASTVLFRTGFGRGLDIDEADEMHAAGVKRVPAGALRHLAVTFEIGLAVFLVDDVVLARHVMNIELGLADDFFRIVELPGFREMGDIAGVDHEGGLGWKPIHLADRFLQGPEGVGIGRLVETDMAVRNLQEAEARGGFF